MAGKIFGLCVRAGFESKKLRFFTKVQLKSFGSILHFSLPNAAVMQSPC
jgi:hypothetical protein